MDSLKLTSRSETWLEKNRKKKRRTRICGCTIALITILVIVGGVFALMYFLKFGLWSKDPPRDEQEPGTYSSTQAVNPLGS
jgi:predicted nucleic acid-binding Zn ribbon protein